MLRTRFRTVSPLLLSLLAAAAPARSAVDVAPPVADAVIDLRQDSTFAQVSGQWRGHVAEIVEVDHRAPGPDLKPTGAPLRTHELQPQAAAPGFDDTSWETLPASSLEARRGTGKLSFYWYRLHLALPERVGELAVAGSTVVFELVVDDYAEVSVDGRQPLTLGRRGGAAVAGYNSPNRLVLTRDARPGQRFELAVLAANGPFSNLPGNYIWVRSATLDFYRPGRLAEGEEVPFQVVTQDPALAAIVPAGARLEKLAGGFQFLEGPVWVTDGYLLFSDPNANVIYRWSPEEGVSIFRTKSGYTGNDIGLYHQPGSNGLTLDRDGRLTIDEHGNRRVTRLEKNGTLTVLADRFEGKRLNSPNDLVYRSDGALYFTDPPFGLPAFHQDPRRELPFTGVFCLKDGRLSVVSRDLEGPNGLAFSPDEKYLYVTDWDPKRKVVMRYEVQPDGSLLNGKVFFDMGGAPGEEALDGLKVDRAGNLYVSGPGGLWILSPEGRHLGTLVGPELAANFAWGDADGRTLYWTARTGLYRIRLNVPGIRP